MPMIIPRSQYDADPQRATGPTIPMSTFGAGGKLDDSFKNLLPKYIPKDDNSVPLVDSIVLKFTPDEIQNMHFEGMLPEGQNPSPVLPHPQKCCGDSGHSALIPRVFGPHESESYKSDVAKAKRGFGLMPPEFAKYTYHMVPYWYTNLINAPMNARQQQEDGQDSSVAMDEEQFRAFTAEYHQALGESLSQALDKLGIKESDFEGNYSALKSPKLREELFRIMNNDPRTKEVMSLLGVKV
jgi:hypothetical protein